MSSEKRRAASSMRSGLTVILSMRATMGHPLSLMMGADETIGRAVNGHGLHPDGLSVSLQPPRVNKIPAGLSYEELRVRVRQLFARADAQARDVHQPLVEGPLAGLAAAARGKGHPFAVGRDRGEPVEA